MRFLVQTYKDGFARLVKAGAWPNTLQGAFRAVKCKWWTLTNWLKDHPDGPVVYDGGSTTCAFCHLYWPKCYVGCPIESAGYAFCKGTPYVDYRGACAWGDIQATLKAAEKELAFVTDLMNKYQSKSRKE